MGKIFNKKSKKEEKEEGLLKILKKVEGTIKDKIKSHLKPIENDINNPNKLAFKKIGFSNKTILKANEILNRIKGLGNKTDYTRLFCVNTNGKHFSKTRRFY